LLNKLFSKAYLVFTMLRHGVSSNVANLINTEFRKDYREKKLPAHRILAIHRKGFTVMDWAFLGLNEANCGQYLTNLDYFKMHPMNGRYNRWIDDKLTLKYLCAGTGLDRYMPEYYFQIDEQGHLLRLMDCPLNTPSPCARDVAEVLRQKKALAFKLTAGSIGAGFYKAEFREDSYWLNGRRLDLEGFCAQIGKLKNYLITEYLRPHEALAAYCPDTVNCFRYLVCRMDGKWKMVRSYIRFGTQDSGFVENYNAGGVLCYLDGSGHFTEGNIIDRKSNRNQVIHTHPDSGAPLSGQIPMWDLMLEAVEEFGRFFPQMCYLGFDFAVTDDHRLKILEINSLTSLDGLQLRGSILETDCADFFRNRIK